MRDTNSRGMTERKAEQRSQHDRTWVRFYIAVQYTMQKAAAEPRSMPSNAEEIDLDQDE